MCVSPDLGSDIGILLRKMTQWKWTSIAAVHCIAERVTSTVDKNLNVIFAYSSYYDDTVSMHSMPSLTQNQPFEDLDFGGRFRLIKSFCDIISICLNGRGWGINISLAAILKGIHYISLVIHISLVIYTYHLWYVYGDTHITATRVNFLLISYPNSVNCDSPGECGPEKDCLRWHGLSGGHHQSQVNCESSVDGRCPD